MPRRGRVAGTALPLREAGGERERGARVTAFRRVGEMAKSLRRVGDAAVAARAHRAQFVQGLRDLWESINPRRPLLDEAASRQLNRRCRAAPVTMRRVRHMAHVGTRPSPSACRMTPSAQGAHVVAPQTQHSSAAKVTSNAAPLCAETARSMQMGQRAFSGTSSSAAGCSRRPQPIAQARGAGDGQRGAELRSPFDDAPQPVHEPALNPENSDMAARASAHGEGLAFAEHRLFDRVHVSVQDGRRQAVLDELDAYHCVFAQCFA